MNHAQLETMYAHFRGCTYEFGMNGKEWNVSWQLAKRANTYVYDVYVSTNESLKIINTQQKPDFMAAISFIKQVLREG